MSNKLYLSGAVGNDGKLRIYEKGEYLAFLEQNKGKRVIMHIDVSDIKKKAAYLKYYWGVIIPRIHEGYLNTGVSISKNSTELEMRKYCQLYEETPKPDGSGYDKKLQSVSDLNDSELYEYIFRLKIIASEFLNVDFDDPITY